MLLVFNIFIILFHTNHFADDTQLYDSSSSEQIDLQVSITRDKYDYLDIQQLQQVFIFMEESMAAILNSHDYIYEQFCKLISLQFRPKIDVVVSILVQGKSLFESRMLRCLAFP